MPESTPSDPRAELAARIMGFMTSQAVYVAAKLGIADLVAERPRAAEDLASVVGADADALYRLLRMLAGHGIFVEQADRSFTNSQLSELLRDEQGSFRDFALVFGDHFYPVFGQTLELVRTGEPAFDAVFGAPWDDYLAAHPDESARFNRFMASGKAAVVEALAAGEWRGDETVVDVGGGNGALLQGLLERVPGLRGIVFDLPHVAAEAERRIGAAGLGDRCKVVAGSFFDAVPPGADAYVLSHILHGWNDDRALEILRNVRVTISTDGRLLVLDGIVAPRNEPGQKLMDLLMLSVDGRERTEDEWQVLLRAGGFEITEIRPAAFTSVLEARPT